jgi:hypothetical protein
MPVSRFRDHLVINGSMIHGRVKETFHLYIFLGGGPVNGERIVVIGINIPFTHRFQLIIFEFLTAICYDHSAFHLIHPAKPLSKMINLLH